MVPVEYYQPKKEKGPSEIATLGYIQMPRKKLTLPRKWPKEPSAGLAATSK